MPCGDTDGFEVVIIGAGAAGLGAAMRLAAARVSPPAGFVAAA
jgi:cation diffusion facilitator CzcD-associated flavoprotein CzcO